MPNDKISKITLPDGTTYDIQGTTYSAGTGLSLSNGVINHSNSVTAQTTQAIYPITIDAQGHIGSYGNAASIPTKTSDLTNDSGFITGMTILSYGSSTWTDFTAAYNANKVVYCRASSNANPASGSQTRLAFMAYVNNATTPTEVEFQYYRSVSTHTESQQGDQIYVYKLNKNNGWSVTTREASVKVAYNNGITGTYSNGVMTLKHANTAITAQATQGLYPIKIDAYGHITGYGSEVTSLPASDVSSWAKASTKPSYTASEVGAVAISAVGAASGVAPLNASSKIDQAYLPSYVDDVIEGYYYNNKFYEEAAHTTEITGEAGKIYIDLSTDKTYRYGGSAYAEVGGGSLVTVSRNLTSGTKSATINIDGTSYDIYSVTNTDEKLKVAEVISGTTYYPVVSSNSTNAETKHIDSTGFNYSSFSGGTNNTGCSWLTLGNNIEIGNVGNKEGRIKLYGSHSGYVELYVDATMTANRILKLPNKSGTIALTTDIPSVPSWALASTKPSYALSEITGASDVQAIEALSGTSGLLKKTAANTWTLDTTAYTTNTGTVTKVTAGTGLAIGSTAQGNFTTSGTINHTNSVTAQTTQALYPIKIDACGHISGYGSAVTSLPANDVPAWAKAENKPSYNISEIVPLESKTYTGLIGSSNDATGASFYFAKIRPTSWDVSWRIKYHIRVYVPGYATYDQISDVCITGSQNNLRSYSVFNTINSAYAAYYHNLYRLKSAGYTAGHSHLLGVGLRGSNNNLNSSYARTFVIDLLEVENCTVTFLDACKKYNTTDIPEAGSTNFDGLSELNFTGNGLQETGDNNDVNYQNRIGYTSAKTKAALYRYQMVVRAKDGELIPISSADNTWTADTATTLKTYSSLPFDPFSEIYYYSSTSTINANGNIGNYSLYRQGLADLRYCFDVRDSANRKLTARLPVYLIATPQADGSAVLYVPSGSKWGPLTQTLPSSDDGKIYIYLGQAYEDSSPYRIELLFEHPIYIYKNGAVRPYTPSNWSEIANKPTTLAGYGITDASISNGVITLGSATITPLTSHQSVVNNNINLSRNTETTIATIGGTAIKIKLPASDNTDTKQNITLATTSKAYLTGVTTAPTSTAQALTGVADTGVYLTATAGEISAVRHSFNVSGTEKAYMVFNNTTNAIDFIFN